MTDSLFAERRGRLGHIVINRPRSLNALNHELVIALLDTLDRWEVDEAIETVAVTGSGDRAFCAGGDIVAMYHDMVNGSRRTLRFLADEYRLNSRIAQYSKPYVAVMDGYVLGGGVGISSHGSHRVVTERTRWGMPETTIGMFPDVGALHLLARAPGEVGTHLALTGRHVRASDVLYIGAADVFVPSSAIPAFLHSLEQAAADDVVARFAIDAGLPWLARHREWIDECYSPDSVQEIIDLLGMATDGAAQAAQKELLRKSPSALVVTLAAIRRARVLPNLEDVLDQDYRIAARVLGGHDFREGVRARVIDKDDNPRWSPAVLEDVPDSMAQSLMEILEDGELGLSSAMVNGSGIPG